MYDIIIIGAGPAGISAGIYAVSRGKRTLILEKAQVGGIIGKVSTVTHYTAIEKQETGATFAARMKEQALQAGVEIVQAEAVHVALTGEVKSVTTDRGIYKAKRIILANGGTPRKLGIPGEKELAGKGMGMNAARDGAAYAGKNVYVVGGADGAVKEALYLAGFAKQVTIVHFEEQLGCIAEFRRKVAAAGNISVRLASRLHAVYGQDQVERLEIASEQDGSIETIEDPGCGIFVYAGILPNTELYTELALEGGYIPTNDKMETAIPGVYAAGDIRVKQVRQVATAVSDGAIAAINAAMEQ
ncbi:FAD-dependent oxidoreductase [Faecalibacterium sp. An192]|uniref:NAD(P)/FAD-dependent oxidoreductase n=1 Tax=Faecalibacterium sp. An192 TaxID=1965581 RepID=UPI000B37D368|nr:FAD-dependent oxidoreductase [Faecalibacterium sp. An192]OUP26521.1 thioredoxin reductase [Faecalibacterium sp. An192]